MGIDPFLYIAFGAGLLAGRIPHRPLPWIGRATFLTVCALIFFLGAELGSIPGFNPLLDIPASLLFAGLICGFTVAIVLVLPRPPAPAENGSAEEFRPRPVWIVFLGALVLGFAAGRSTSFPTATFLTASLYVLLALVAFDLRFSKSALGRVWVPLLSAIVGALAAATVFELIDPVGWVPALATALGFGWYTLAGPLVTARFGASLGLLAFLTNFLRENLTLVLSPYLGRWVRSEGLVAMGGATSMDTTLYSAVRYGAPAGDPTTGTLALASGLILTVAASLVLPLLLSL
ncbi:MAG: lysine exporter LysO family protein [Thermoplasmata archaeon]|nr:lysine exporter LysO family protein [Thermoplasmata archaeon]